MQQESQSLVEEVEEVEAPLQEAGLEVQPRRAPLWRIAGVAAAAAAVLSFATLVAVRHTKASHEAVVHTSAVTGLYAETFDPQGRKVCGPQHCDCRWAETPGECTAVRNDGTDCFGCCCPGQQGGQYGQTNHQSGGFVDHQHSGGYSHGSYHVVHYTSQGNSFFGGPMMWALLVAAVAFCAVGYFFTRKP